MERLIFIPIERLEMRYGGQWFEWFMREFNKRKDEDIHIMGDEGEAIVQCGEVLDIYHTSTFKLRQILEAVELIMDTPENIPVTVFFMDLWFPALEVVGYIRDNAKRDITIKGIIHAGSYDDYDYLALNGCRDWCRPLEKSWFRIVDEIFVATDSHKNMILEKTGMRIENKFKKVRFPVYTNEGLRQGMKDNAVVFPHRLSMAKQPEVFDEVERRYTSKYNDGTVFIRTHKVCASKRDYYKVLARCKVIFSSALQETFGIAMLEGQNLGCIPVAPDRLSYPEVITEYPLYNTIDEAVELVRQAIVNYSLPSVMWPSDVKDIVENI